MKTWTPEEIAAVIERTDKAAEGFIGRAVYALFERQTRDEQALDTTVVHNGVGFSGADAEILSSFAKFWKKAGFLTAKQIALARKKLPKYRKQLAEIAAEKAPAKEAREITDASDIGLKPGEWPETLTHGGEEYKRADVERYSGGDILNVTYIAGGKRLVVVND